MPSLWSRRLVVCVALPLLTGCPRDKSSSDDFAVADAKQALEESALDAQGQSLAADVIELSTNFTIGDAVQSAAEELETFLHSQIPCAKLSSVEGATTIDFGAKGSGCLYHGHVVSGQSRVTIASNDNAEVTIEHEWSNLSNGLVDINGTATVTYDLANPSRHVEHDVTVTRVSDGYALQGQGDRLQKPLAEGLAVGFEVSGTRDWSSARGSSSLVIEGVQMRWGDPVPQAGSYRLLTSKNREILLTFTRKDSDTITVTTACAGRQFRFDVSITGNTQQRL